MVRNNNSGAVLLGVGVAVVGIGFLLLNFRSPGNGNGNGNGQATLTVNPTSGPAGMDVQLDGTGFPPLTDVAITIGGIPRAPIDSDEAGNISRQRMIPPELLPGDVIIRAEAGGVFAEVDFVVTPGNGGGGEITGIVFDFGTLEMYTQDSDLWRSTWADDDQVYTSWGDGPGFGNTRAAAGIARLEGNPPGITGRNINNSAFRSNGKMSSLVSVDGVLYGILNLQNDRGDYRLVRSSNHGATWSNHYIQNGNNPLAHSFIQHGQDYDEAPDSFVYMLGKSGGPEVFLLRAPRNNLTSQSALRWFVGLDNQGNPVWESGSQNAVDILGANDNAGDHGQMTWNPMIGHYVMGRMPGGPNKLEVWVSPDMWGPWTRIHNDNSFGGMGSEGEGLTCDFVRKWFSSDGLTMWAIVSVWGNGARQGINAHDRLALIRTRLVVS